VFISYKGIEAQTGDQTNWLKESVADETKTLFNQGSSLVKQRRYEEALRTYQQILWLNPLDLDALNELDQLAALLVREGENSERRRNLDDALTYYKLAHEIRITDNDLATRIYDLENR
jgi:tetratricopeptide (TPR) repeat protein